MMAEGLPHVRGDSVAILACDGSCLDAAEDRLWTLGEDLESCDVVVGAYGGVGSADELQACRG